MTTTRLNRAIAGAVVLFVLLLLTAVLRPLLSRPPALRGSALPAVSAARDVQQVSDITLAHQAHMQAVQAYLAAVAAQQAAAAPKTAAPPPAPVRQQSSGVLSCGAVEQLWTSAGGPPGLAVLMAEIAGAESSRNPAAPYGGLWQIQGGQPVPGDISDPVINAKNAVAKFRSQGLGAWTTYTSGAYLSHPC